MKKIINAVRSLYIGFSLLIPMPLCLYFADNFPKGSFWSYVLYSFSIIFLILGFISITYINEKEVKAKKLDDYLGN